MDPNAQYSPVIGPSWKPQVWVKGPDQLVAEARQALFSNLEGIEDGVLGASEPEAMAGGSPQDINESEQLIDPTQPPEGQGRASQWKTNLNALRATEPLAGTSKPVSWSPDPGTPNPPA
jgi:hypothetical protein